MRERDEEEEDQRRRQIQIQSHLLFANCTKIRRTNKRIFSRNTERGKERRTDPVINGRPFSRHRKRYLSTTPLHSLQMKGERERERWVGNESCQPRQKKESPKTSFLLVTLRRPDLYPFPFRERYSICKHIFGRSQIRQGQH